MIRKKIGRYFKIIICCLLSASYLPSAAAEDTSNNKILFKISKSGLNRISNPPYRIIQVTGDESQFRLKYDEDGQNIYLMPLGAIGDKIELSLKNNAGFIQDLELEVANIKGQTLSIDNEPRQKADLQYQDLTQMLKAMKENKVGKFYAQEVKIPLGEVGKLQVIQTKLYKWRDLRGGVFLLRNKTKKLQKFDFLGFTRRFDQVVTSFVAKDSLEPKETVIALIIQKCQE